MLVIIRYGHVSSIFYIYLLGVIPWLFDIVYAWVRLGQWDLGTTGYLQYWLEYMYTCTGISITGSMLVIK